MPVQKSKRARVVIDDDEESAADSDDLPIVRAPPPPLVAAPHQDPPHKRLHAPPRRTTRSVTRAVGTEVCLQLADGIDGVALLSDELLEAYTPAGYTRGTFAKKHAKPQRTPPPAAPDRRTRVTQLYGKSAAAAVAEDDENSSTTTSTQIGDESAHDRHSDDDDNGDSGDDEEQSTDASPSDVDSDSSGSDGAQNQHYAQDECSTDYGSYSDDEERTRRLHRKMYFRKPPPDTVDLSKYSDAEADDDDGGDDANSSSADSLADFVVADDDAPVALQLSAAEQKEVDEFLLRLRIDFCTPECDAFRNLLYHITRCVFDPAHEQRVSTSQNTALCVEEAFVQGRVAQSVWTRPEDRAKALMLSSVWDEDTLKLVNRYSVVQLWAADECGALSAGERAQIRAEDCTVCGRRGHPIRSCLLVYSIRTSPVPHRAHTLYDDVRVLERYAYEQSTAGINYVRRQGDARCVKVLCGVFCGQRLMLYHQLVHYWLKCAWRCYVTLKGRGLPPKATAERVLDRKEEPLVATCWREYNRVLDECYAYQPSKWQRSAYQQQDEEEP